MACCQKPTICRLSKNLLTFLKINDILIIESEVRNMREYKVTYQTPDHVLHIGYIQQQNRTKAFNEWVERNPTTHVLSIIYVHYKPTQWIF